MKLCLEFIIIVVSINSGLCAKAFRIRRNVLKDKSMRWPDAIVPYTINEAFSASEKEVILRAMKDIELVSCVRFKTRSGENGFIDVVKGEKCSAYVGYSGRRIEVTLGAACVTSSTVLHELFHTLGFSHEHARPDRNKYIKVYKNRIKPEKFHNFEKKSSEKYTSYGLPYDYNSVMHYHDRAFVNGSSQKSLEPIIGSPVLGKATGLSKTDILKLNKMYRCRKRKEEEGGKVASWKKFGKDFGKHWEKYGADFRKEWEEFGSDFKKKWKKFGSDLGNQFQTLSKFGK